jgi:hypothetical protein
MNMNANGKVILNVYVKITGVKGVNWMKIA